MSRIKVIACATVIEDMLPIMPAEVDYEILEYGLHLVPESLKKALQTAIDRCSDDFDVIILGYGLCSLAVVGLQARSARLVIPKVDDCIALFFGSRERYSQVSKQEPGTYYLTKGWIEVGDTILDEYTRTVEKYGEQRADRIMGQLFARYTRLVYIDTGHANQDYYRAYAQKTANQFHLRYEEMEGSSELIQKMLFGPWDGAFVVVQPGETVAFTSFTPPSQPAG